MKRVQSSKATTPTLIGQVIGRSASSFRRFSRKGYAIFASLHCQVRIGVLSVGVLASVNIPKVQAIQVMTHPATEDDADERELTEVTVSGSMAPLTALQSARIVGVITRQQIESSSAQSVNDLLKLAPGVDVRQRGGFGIQTDISINGGTFDQITLLLNGVNISSPHTGHLAADFPVSLSDIERIEVLEGAASRVYGASAFGGAINIVTKRGRNTPDSRAESKDQNHRFSIDAGAQGGSYATFGGDVRCSVLSAPSHLGQSGVESGGSVSAQYLRSDGATTNSDFSRGTAYLRGYYDSPEFALDWQAGFSHKNYGANTFYSAAYPDQYERNTRFIVSLGAETKGRVRVRPELYWHRLYDNFELIRGSRTGENFHRSDVQGARVSADVNWVAGHSVVAAELREEGIYSTSLGRKGLNEVHRVPGEDIYYSRYDSRTNISVNMEHNILLPHFTASIGLLANYNTRFDNGLCFYPGIDVAYTPAAHWRLYAGYNKGFRLPTFTDLYYKSPTHEGNQGMKAEESHSFQVGVTYRTSFLNATLKAFYHHGIDLIDWVMYSPADVFHSANFNLDNIGFQAQGDIDFATLTSSDKVFFKLLSVGYTYMDQRRHDHVSIYNSNYAMEYLRHKLVATLYHRIASRLTASWSLRWQDRVGSYILYENAKSTGQLVDYSPYATLDVKLRWQAPHYELWAQGTNLTNHTYYDLGNIPQPGIVVEAGVRVNF